TDEELLLDFSLAVKAGRLRLSKIEGPRLVPIDVRSPMVDNVTSAQSLEPSANRDDAQMSAHASGTLATPKTGHTKPNPEVAAPRTPKDATNENIGNPFSSLNRRLILGVEQSGAASADSQGNPFFDLFIGTPLSRDDTGTSLFRPRFSIWGDVRLTSTPEQVGALADVSSDAIDSITGGKLNKLSQGFDFVVGPEIRLMQFHHTDLSAIGAFGAINPLSPKASTQIFKVPDLNSSQASAFFEKYKGAVGKDFIAFIAPDRDRFLRQYYAGFRFRTYSYDDADDLQNLFPAMLDVTFGQSEAITGGRLHKFVVGIDGFYPLPFPDKSRFLYLFGTAKFKAGGTKNTATPFILDTAASSVVITDPKVFIADPTPTNRDYYRIGFGVDLIELFNFAKKKGAEEAAKQ
ncbi:MAG: hypothetical protein QOD33_531, partial [Pyrinomonadaceae bacterium]|nr:hypothetical protein [Pyrinomonadaceae bacterium]